MRAPETKSKSAPGSARGPRAVFGGPPKTSFPAFVPAKRCELDRLTKHLAGRQTRQASGLRSPKHQQRFHVQ